MKSVSVHWPLMGGLCGVNVSIEGLMAYVHICTCTVYCLSSYVDDGSSV